MRTLDEWGVAAPPPTRTRPQNRVPTHVAWAPKAKARYRQPPLLLGSLERGLDLLLGLELEDLLGQRIGLGLGPLGDDLARAQN